MFFTRSIAKRITRVTSGVKIPEIFSLSDWKVNSVSTYQQSFQFKDVFASDNLCLSISKSKISDNLLPQKIELFKVPGFIPAPKIFTISDVSILHPETFNLPCTFRAQEACSENLAEPFNLIKIFEYEEKLATSLEISENLFKPLLIPKVFGQNYGVPKDKTSPSEDGELVIKEKRSKEKVSLRSPNQWDLLQPVLLPPLSLEFPTEFDFYRELRGYQKQGIGWLVDRESALLADEMGTGKTVQAVNALRLLFRQAKIRAALVVCPPAVIGSVNLTVETGSSEGWCGHFYHWASKELEVAVIHGGSQAQRKLAWQTPAHVYITTYDTLRTDIQNQILDDCYKFDCIILDEAQKIKNRERKTSQAIRWLQPQYRWALTGTPIENSIDDVKSLFDFVRPGTFRNKGDETSQAVKGLIEPYMLRRLKQDVLQDLPEKVRQEDWLELDSNQKRDYYQTLQAGKQKIETSIGIEQGIYIRRHIFALLNELKQICNFAKGQSESPKTDLLLEYVETIAANKKKVLVFSQYRKEGIDKIASFLDSKEIRYVLYIGNSDQQKNQALSDFRSDPDITVFLATIQTAGYGITLTEATYVIHFDHPWNPAKMQNAEDRTHRIGQKSGVTVYSFWMKGTIEERIKRKLIEKSLLVEDTVDDLAVKAIESGLSTEDWLDIFDIQSTGQRAGIKQVAQPKSKSRKLPVSEPKKPSSGATYMMDDRFRSLEENLELTRKDIAGREKAKILAPFEEKTRIELGIQELRRQMRPLEEEYWQLLAVRSTQVEISEPEAEEVVAELVEKVGQLQSSNQYTDEILHALHEIYLEVSKPDTPAAAKLKGTLSMLPPFVNLGYEVEIDTENFLRTHLPTFTKWCRALARK